MLDRSSASPTTPTPGRGSTDHANQWATTSRLLSGLTSWPLVMDWWVWRLDTVFGVCIFCGFFFRDYLKVTSVVIHHFCINCGGLFLTSLFMWTTNFKTWYLDEVLQMRISYCWLCKITTVKPVDRNGFMCAWTRLVMAQWPNIELIQENKAVKG